LNWGRGLELRQQNIVSIRDYIRNIPLVEFNVIATILIYSNADD
jgi:hypothetical protein